MESMTTSAHVTLIQELRRDGVGHTGMGAALLVDKYAHELAEKLRQAGHHDAAALIDPGLDDQA